jgi:hypothetical protein
MRQLQADGDSDIDNDEANAIATLIQGSRFQVSQVPQ